MLFKTLNNNTLNNIFLNSKILSSVLTNGSLQMCIRLIKIRIEVKDQILCKVVLLKLS